MTLECQRSRETRFISMMCRIQKYGMHNCNGLPLATGLYETVGMFLIKKLYMHSGDIKSLLTITSTLYPGYTTVIEYTTVMNRWSIPAWAEQCVNSELIAFIFEPCMFFGRLVSHQGYPHKFIGTSGPKRIIIIYNYANCLCLYNFRQPCSQYSTHNKFHNVIDYYIQLYVTYYTNCHKAHNSYYMCNK